MIKLTQQAITGGVPRLAMINSFAGFGRISTAVSLPIISTLGVQVCPVPTSVLSNHLAFPVCSRQDFTPYMEDYLEAWEALSLTFDGLYCGYLGSCTQIEIVKKLLQSPCMTASCGRPFFLLDPVMADHGRFYSSMNESHCEQLKELVAYADLITPNITEACFLTETPFENDFFSEEKVVPICRKLQKLMERYTASSKEYTPRIVITGLREEEHFVNYVWEDQKGQACRIPIAGPSRSGTGDIFASILAADALLETPFYQSVEKASHFIACCIRGTEEAGIPIKEGVLFEKFLPTLMK